MPDAKKNKRADRVWDRLIQCYGTRVAEMYGIEIPKPWADAVAELIDEQIAHGLRMVIRVSPDFVPTLGKFIDCCQAMPVAQHESVATLQEQLCEYVALKMHDRLQRTWAYSGPWTYLYREWIDHALAKNKEGKCAECIGVVIEIDENTRMKFTVAEMQADTQTYQRALRNFKPGPRPNQKQLDAFHGRVSEAAEHMKL